MKWAITIDELKKNKVSGITKETFKPLPKIRARNASHILELNKADENISKCFVVYASKKDLANALANSGYEQWLDEPIPEKYLSKMKKKSAQEHYELFCGGWVQYHNTIVQGGRYEHILYFDWKSKPGRIIALIKTEVVANNRKLDAISNEGSGYGQPNSAQRDTGYVIPPTSPTDPPKPPAPPPPYA